VLKGSSGSQQAAVDMVHAEQLNITYITFSQDNNTNTNSTCK